VSARYQLPCSCGRQIVVEPRQAGEAMVCSCGASLQVPTLLEMRSLEPVPALAEPRPSDSGWGGRHRLLLLGGVFVSVAMVAGVWLSLNPPLSSVGTVSPETIQQTAQTLTPAQTWAIWKRMEQGLDRRVDREYAAAMVFFRIWQGVTVAVALIGVVLVVMGILSLRGSGGH